MGRLQAVERPNKTWNSKGVLLGYKKQIARKPIETVSNAELEPVAG